MKISPIYSHYMALFDSVEDKYHKSWMNNLYNSASFCKKLFNHKKNVMMLGVIRKGIQGIPRCMKQELVENRAAQGRVPGIVKLVVLECDKDCSNLVASFFYDFKPVHFLLMSCSSLRCQLNDKVVFNVETGLRAKM